MQKSGKLSIIVPTYNVELYLEDCVNSLLIQDYKDCEIIIVDDGSTDGSGEVADRLLSSDPRIKVIHQPNGGLSAARNTGLRNATGDYISFIDSDDLVTTNMYIDLISALDKSNADVAVCNFEVFNKESRYTGNRYKDEVIDYSPANQVDFYRAALDSSCNKVYKAEAIFKNRLEFEHKNKVAQEDYWFLVRLFSHVSRIVTIRAAHYLYRERGSSITKSHSDGDITKRCLDFLSLSRAYISEHTDREYNEFLSYQYMNMFMASINNASDTKPSTILTIVNSYFKDPQFSQAISTKSLRKVLLGSGLKHQYDKVCFALLRCRLTVVYALLESVRLKKLRSNTRTDLYFE